MNYLASHENSQQWNNWLVNFGKFQGADHLKKITKKIASSSRRPRSNEATLAKMRLLECQAIYIFLTAATVYKSYPNVQLEMPKGMHYKVRKMIFKINNWPICMPLFI